MNDKWGGKEHMRFMHITRRSLAPILLLITALGCASSAWRSALDANSISAYQKFLQRYPDTEFSSEARRQVDSLLAEDRRRLEASAYEAARCDGTSGALEEFLTRYPDGAGPTEAIRTSDRGFAAKNCPWPKL